MPSSGATDANPGVVRTLVLGAAAIALAALALLLYFRSREPDPMAEAKRLAGFLADRNVEAVAGYTVEAERGEYGSVRLHELIGWCLERSDLAQPVVVESEQELDQARMRGGGFFRITASGPTVKRAPLVLQVVLTDESARAPALVDRLLMHRWASSSMAIAADSRAEAMMRRILKGVQADRPELERLGVTHLHHRDGLKSLDEVEAYYVEAIAKIRRDMPTQRG